MPEHRSTDWTTRRPIVASFRSPTRQLPKFRLAMIPYTPRRGVAAPRWFVAALLGGAAALTAMTAALPTAATSPAPASWRIAR
jgi:hypothetical protein